MIENLVINLFAIVTFLFLTGVIDLRNRRGFLDDKRPYYGVLFGLLGIVLMYWSIPLDLGFIMDLRHIGIIIPFVYLGAMPGLIAAGMIVLTRLFVTGFSQGALVAAAAMTLFTAIVATLAPRLRMKNFHQSLVYNALAILLLAVSILTNLGITTDILQVLALEFLFSFIALYIVDRTGSYIFTTNKIYKSLKITTAELKTIVCNLKSGVLVEDDERRLMLTNQVFLDQFGIEGDPDSLRGSDCRALLEKSAMLFEHPESFIESVHQRIESRHPSTGRTFEMKDGRTLERDYVPIDVAGKYHGHFWHYRDLTSRIAIERSLVEANEQLKALSFVDGLTGIANRRTFDEALEREFQVARRKQQPLSLLMIDIDHFKAYNDRYGHPAGDQVLIRVAEIIRDHVNRPADLVSRYGGEEFVVLLPDTPRDGALQVAERLLKAVDQAVLPHDASPVADHITLSIGLATQVPRMQAEAAGLLEASDASLYRAKAAGRHRVDAT